MRLLLDKNLCPTPKTPFNEHSTYTYDSLVATKCDYKKLAGAGMLEFGKNHEQHHSIQNPDVWENWRKNLD